MTVKRNPASEESPLTFAELAASHEFLPTLFQLHKDGQIPSNLRYTFILDEKVRKKERNFNNFHRFVDYVDDYRSFPGARKFLRARNKGVLGDILSDSTSRLLRRAVKKGRIPTQRQVFAAITKSAKARDVTLLPKEAVSLAHLLRFHYVLSNPGFKRIYEDAHSKFENLQKARKRGGWVEGQRSAFNG